MYDIVEHRCAFLALCSGVTTQIWPSSMKEVDWGTHHAVPVLSFLMDAAKSCGTCASEFPDLNHLGFWLFDVLLSTCTLQQGIQLQSPKVVGQHSTTTIKTQRKVVPVPRCRHTHSHMHVAFNGLCAVCACMGLVVRARVCAGALGKDYRTQTARTINSDYGSLPGTSQWVTGKRLQVWMNVFLDWILLAGHMWST